MTRHDWKLWMCGATLPDGTTSVRFGCSACRRSVVVLRLSASTVRARPYESEEPQALRTAGIEPDCALEQVRQAMTE